MQEKLGDVKLPVFSREINGHFWSKLGNSIGLLANKSFKSKKGEVTKFIYKKNSLLVSSLLGSHSKSRN